MLPWIILGMGIGALVMLGIATGLIIWATRPAGRTVPTIEPAVPEPAVGPVAVTSSRSPVSLNARLDEPLSRGLWLVKWFLAIPHFIILVFLWIAFFVTTFIAWWAILFTARYPRGLFGFNVGVMRWTWRVSYYATSGIGTDKYPPFSLQPNDEYPATLDVEYPERLSRGLIFVKWWLLAIPHYIIIGFFVGGGWYARGRANGWEAAGGPGLIGWVTIFAGVALLFTGKLPKRPLRLRDGHEPLVLPSGRLRDADDRPLPTVRVGPRSNGTSSDTTRAHRTTIVATSAPVAVAARLTWSASAYPRNTRPRTRGARKRSDGGSGSPSLRHLAAS